MMTLSSEEKRLGKKHKVEINFIFNCDRDNPAWLIAVNRWVSLNITPEMFACIGNGLTFDELVKEAIENYEALKKEDAQ